MKNINTTGTFKEYVESIAAEIKQLLPEYTVEVQNTDWSPQQDDSIPALAVVFDIINGCSGNFSIAEFEFEQDKHNAIALENLATIRLTDAIWCLKNARDEYDSLIKLLEGEQK